jgi:two-component system, cell cycle sensor histidine kinase and response regulator CckA
MGGMPSSWSGTEILHPPGTAGAPDGRVPLVLLSAMEDEGPVRRVLDAAPDAMVCVDAGGRITLVNSQAERLFGYRRAELEGELVELLVPEAIRAGHPGRRAGYLADPVPRPMGPDMQLAGRRRDGSTFPAEISLSAIETDEGTLVMAAVRDVTQQREAAATAARLASIIQSSHDAVIGETLARVVTSWNPGAERLYGYSAGEMVGRHIDVLILPVNRGAEKGIQASITRGDRVEQFESERVRKDGTTVSVSMTLSPIADSSGTIIGVSTVSRDLTGRQRAEARFRGLIEAAPDAMVCVDAAGRITLANAQAERLFGYRRAELEGQLVELLVPDAIRAGHPGRRAGYAADPVPRPMGAGMALAGRRRDGSTFPAEISLSGIETDEGALVMAAVRDVTQQRQQQADLERAYRNLESFAYSIAHDLRTPLRALAGFSSALMEDYGESLDAVGRGYAERIETASEQMAALIDDLLHLSRVARVDMNLQPVDLGSEAVSIAGDLQDDNPDRRVGFTGQQPVWVLADRILVRTVLQNLLGNAWKFTAGRAEALIEFGTTPVAEDARVCCYVRDNGAGFDFSYVHKLFLPFQRLHTTSEFPGTGVGLASVRQIVERHGGRVWAEGAVGEGATFYFTLPATETASSGDSS